MEGQRDTFIQLFNNVFQGNTDAICLAMDLMEVFHIWDDIVDDDKVLSESSINSAFRRLIYDIPKNPFYQRYQDELVPMVYHVFLSWRDANVLERMETSNGDSDLHKAYVLRAEAYSLIVYITSLIGGDEWARQVGPHIRRCYGETLEDYMEEMKYA